MFLWIVLAILSHVGNALVFVADKTILESDSSIGDPLWFAAWSGVISGVTGIILPFFFALPTVEAIGLSIIGGVFWLLALVLFFTGLKLGEPSRIAPIAGSAVPLFTLVLAFFLLGELLTPRELLAVLVLIGGGAVLSISWRGVTGLSWQAVLVTVLSGAAFAAHFITVDQLYEAFGPFITAFAYRGLGMSFVALLLLGWLYVFRSAPQKTKLGKHRKRAKRNWFTLVSIVFVSSKIVSALASLAQQKAIELGNVTLVNALQGTQYVFILVLAVFISRRWPRLFREELGMVAMRQKISGIVLVGIGLLLLI